MPATFVRLARLGLFRTSVVATLANVPAVGRAQLVGPPPADPRIGLPALPVVSFTLAGLDPTETRQEGEDGGRNEMVYMLVGGSLGAAAGLGLGLTLGDDECPAVWCLVEGIETGLLAWAGGAMGAWVGGRIADGDPSLLGTTLGALVGVGVGTLAAAKAHDRYPVGYFLLTSVSTGTLAALLGSAR